MSSKNYLQQIGKYETLLRNKQNEVYQYEALATNAHASLEERVQTSSDGDRLSLLVSAAVDAQEELKDLLEAYIELKQRITKQIEGMVIRDEDGIPIDTSEYEVLHLRYIDRLLFEDVADKMCLSTRHMYTIHERALERFEEKYLSK